MWAIKQIGYMPGYGPYSKLGFTKPFPVRISVSIDTITYDPEADFKVLMQSEPPNLYIKFCGMVHENYKNFDLILSYDDRILPLPNAMEFCPAGTWVSDDMKLNKTNQISFLMSSKINGEAYRMRFKIKKRLEKIKRIGDFDLKWHRSPPLHPNKDDFFNQAKFNIACENQIMNNMYSEKLLDCFKSYTVPIYYGCSNIEKYFNPKGIIRFQTVEELDSILNDLTPDMYDHMMPYVQENYELTRPFWEKNIFQRIEDIVEQKLSEKYASNDLLSTLLMLD